MKPIIKKLFLEKVDYYIVHLSLINCVLPVKLGQKEIEVMAHFMSCKEPMFSFQNRKIVREKLHISLNGLSNYINSLKNKKFLSGERSKIMIFPLLKPDNSAQDYMFKLINIDEENTN